MRKWSAWIVFLLTLTLPFCKSKKNTEVRVELKNGVKYVYNPDKPIKGKIPLQLKEILKINLEEIGGVVLSYPGSVARDSMGNIFVTDGKTYKVYKINTKGKLLKSFMKKGEGPGEFKFFPRLYIRGNKLMVASYQKLAEFDLEGNLIKEWKFEKTYPRLLPLKENLVLGGFLKFSKEKGVMPEKEIILMSPEGNNQRLIFKSKSTGRLFIKVGKYTFSVSTNPFIIPDVIWAYNPASDMIYLAESDKYKIYVKDIEGNTRMVIEREYTKVPFTPQDKEKVMSKLQKMPEKFLNALRKNLPDQLCALSSIYATPSGYILARSVKAYNKFDFDVFSPQGKFMYTLELPEGIDFEWVLFPYNGIISTVKEDDDTYYYIEYKVKNLNEVFGK